MRLLFGSRTNARDVKRSASWRSGDASHRPTGLRRVWIGIALLAILLTAASSMDPRTAVHAPILLRDRFDAPLQRVVAVDPLRRRSPQPGVVPAGGEAQHPAHRPDWRLGPVRLDLAFQTPELLALHRGQPVATPPFIQVRLPSPVADRLRRRLQLPGQFPGAVPRSHQLHHPLPVLGRITAPSFPPSATSSYLSLEVSTKAGQVHNSIAARWKITWNSQLQERIVPL